METKKAGDRAADSQQTQSSLGDRSTESTIEKVRESSSSNGSPSQNKRAHVEGINLGASGLEALGFRHDLSSIAEARLPQLPTFLTPNREINLETPQANGRHSLPRHFSF